MATIGLDKLFYANIEEDELGYETYGEPQVLAKAMTADLTVELNEAVLYADDGAAEVVKEFKSGTLSLGVDNIGAQVAADLTGTTIDTNGVVISTSEDGGRPVAVGFRAKRSNGKYRYFWLYRVKFGIPATNLATKGDSITFSTPTIEGTIMRRNRPDLSGKHPWKAEVTEGAEGVDAGTVADWYNEVYEPDVGSLGGGPITPLPTNPGAGEIMQGGRVMDNERSAVISIGGTDYELILTTRATKEIAGRYGGLENLGDKLMKNENFEMALEEIVWLITLLANQSILIHNLKHRDSPKEPLTAEEVELLTVPSDLAGYKTAITEALYKGTKRNVESEADPKNAEVG